MTIELHDLHRRVAELPPLPGALTEVIGALGSGSLSTQRCIALIERDPALAARLLRLANSAFYGRPGAIGSISGAVSLLGLRTVAGVLAAATLHGSLKVDDCPAFALDAYWRHAIASALISSTLAPPLGLDPAEAFLAGLMHDIGQLILAVLSPREFEQVLEASVDASDLLATELAHLGVTHTQVGETVARRWHFPASIVQAIAGHHRALPEQPAPPADIATLIPLCDQVVRALDRQPEPGGHAQVPPAVWQALRVAPDEQAAFYERIAQGVSDFCRHL